MHTSQFNTARALIDSDKEIINQSLVAVPGLASIMITDVISNNDES